MKRWTKLLLMVCMVVAILPAVSVAARAADTSGACGDNLTWTFDEATGTLTIDGTGPMWDWKWDGTPWYDYHSAIKSVAIGNSVTSIGDCAFNFCDILIQVTIPNSVTCIGNRAFYWCYNLTKVAIPGSVTYIGEYAFEGTSLTEVTIPDSVASIGDRAFSGGDRLTNIAVDSNNPHYCSADGVLFDKSKTILIQYPTRKSAENYIIPTASPPSPIGRSATAPI